MFCSDSLPVLLDYSFSKASICLRYYSSAQAILLGYYCTPATVLLQIKLTLEYG